MLCFMVIGAFQMSEPDLCISVAEGRHVLAEGPIISTKDKVLPLEPRADAVVVTRALGVEGYPLTSCYLYGLCRHKGMSVALSRQ